MSLRIDLTKVQEQLARAVGSRNVFTPQSICPEQPNLALPTAEIFSTLSGMPPHLEQAHQRLLGLRQRIIEAGFEPLSAADLNHEIDEIRGR